MVRILDDDNCSVIQRINGIRQYCFKSRDDKRCGRIVQTKENHAHFAFSRQGYDLAEIEVKSENGSIFGGGLDENFAVGKSLETFIA